MVKNKDTYAILYGGFKNEKKKGQNNFDLLKKNVLKFVPLGNWRNTGQRGW